MSKLDAFRDRSRAAGRAGDVQEFFDCCSDAHAATGRVQYRQLLLAYTEGLAENPDYDNPVTRALLRARSGL
jgi:hypothetical protein